MLMTQSVALNFSLRACLKSEVAILLFGSGGGMGAIRCIAAIAGKFWEKYYARNETKGSGA